MTQEEKAKAYDEAIKKAESLYKASEPMSGCNVIIETLFPEFKESEDEKIRKWLIAQLKIKIGDNATLNNMIYKAIAWLEKQGIEKITVKPKFKVGDWIIYSNEEVCLITGLDDNGYFVDKECYIPFNCEGNMRLWTIQDAKDGDVLTSIMLTSISFHSNCTFIFNGLDNWKFDAPNGDRAVATGYCCLSASADNMEFGIQGPDCIEVDTVKPATKEQRDLLFQKMKEAGYEWNTENKELKKIEHKPACSDDKKLTDVNHEYFNELLENNNSKDINDYAYQVAYCMSHDWANETPTWDDVQKACKLGAKWKEKHHKSKWNEQENKDKLKSLLFNAKSITYESFKNEDDPLVAIYFNNLIEIIDKL